MTGLIVAKNHNNHSGETEGAGALGLVRRRTHWNRGSKHLAEAHSESNRSSASGAFGASHPFPSVRPVGPLHQALPMTMHTNTSSPYHPL
jgi:hypothetical protein